MLGFVFSEKPSIQAQLEYLTRKANKRYFVLLHYKRAGIKRERLRDIYCSILRSIVEYSSNAYHPQLNNYQSNALENLQKRALRAIYGYDKSYPELLNDSGLLRLSSRREAAFSKFNANTVKNPKYAHWFPLKPSLRHTRTANKYLEEHCSGNRLFKSPIYSMRRNLNKTCETPEIDLSGLFNKP